MKPHLAARTPVVLCAKGVELSTGRVMSELVEEELPGSPLAVLSGPTFAIEVARGSLTVVCVTHSHGKMLATTIPKAIAEKIEVAPKEKL